MDEKRKKRKSPGTNWEKLSASLKSNGKKRQKAAEAKVVPVSVSTPMRSDIVALDCEMVGVGSSGRESALARCTLVDGSGMVLYDHFVRPRTRITDFRTKYSGVRSSDLKKDVAHSFEQCQREAASIISGRLLVGHALENDLKVLLLSHPRSMIRDTSRYPPLMRRNARAKLKPRKLRDLAKQYLNISIQSSEHSSVEDARAALRLYLHFQAQWESWILQGRKQSSFHGATKTTKQEKDLAIAAESETSPPPEASSSSSPES